MKVKISALISIVLATLISCKSMYFKVPQPLDTDNLKAFPDSIRGFYTSEDVDTLVIDAYSFVMGNKNGSVEGAGHLNPDSMTLKLFKNYFVLSMKEDKYWNVLLFQYINDTLKAFCINIDDNENEKLEKLSKITPFRTIKNDEGKIINYLINPSKKQFEQLVDLDLFTETGRFIKKRI